MWRAQDLRTDADHQLLKFDHRTLKVARRLVTFHRLLVRVDLLHDPRERRVVNLVNHIDQSLGFGSTHSSNQPVIEAVETTRCCVVLEFEAKQGSYPSRDAIGAYRRMSIAFKFNVELTIQRLPRRPSDDSLWRITGMMFTALTVPTREEEAEQRHQQGRAAHMTRSPDDLLEDHIRAVNSGDMQAIMADYADDAQVLTAQGALKGKGGVEAFFTQAFSLLPKAQLAVKEAVTGENCLLVWWSADSSAGRIDDGIDTFVIERGLITLQTPTFTIQPQPQ